LTFTEEIEEEKTPEKGVAKAIAEYVNAIISEPKKDEISENITIEDINRAAKEQIIVGDSKGTASTGTPIDNLTGAAKYTSQKSNRGRGSKETGGGGMEEGDMVENTLAFTTGFIANNNYSNQINTENDDDIIYIK
jgi:hypothetical protein